MRAGPNDAGRVLGVHSWFLMVYLSVSSVATKSTSATKTSNIHVRFSSDLLISEPPKARLPDKTVNGPDYILQSTPMPMVLASEVCWYSIVNRPFRPNEICAPR